MVDDLFIEMQCPKCGFGHANTWAHLVAHWEATFTCQGCGIQMKVDREEALAAHSRGVDGGQITVIMTE